MKGHITKAIWILCAVSLFTDLASEMLYPVIPAYLESIGFGILVIGILEGIAEATAGLSKGYFGMMSDQYGKRAPFIRIGYSLSALAKPLMTLVAHPAWVLITRSVDRLGKGIRTGARDAMLSDSSNIKNRATVFGLHRAMDTAGAFLGPVVALIFLKIFPGAYKSLFILSVIPGLIAIGLTLLVKDVTIPKENIRRTPVKFFDFIHYWRTSRPEYKSLTRMLLFFALFNSSDLFLLMKAKETGCADTGMVISLYITYNLVYALAAYPAGKMADHIGLKRMMFMGLILFSIVYFGMSLANEIDELFLLFSLYGLFAAATEGIAKAWISNTAEPEKTATAIGSYTAFQSIAVLFASSFAGLVWHFWGPAATFVLSGCVGVACGIWCIMLSAPNRLKN